MDRFMTFDEVMSTDRGRRVQPMQVFEAIQGGQESMMPMLLGEILTKSISCGGSQGNVPILEGDVAVPGHIDNSDCVGFLVRFLEQQGRHASPGQNKIWTKKMFQKIAQELKVIPPGDCSIIRNADIDPMSNWVFYVKNLISELRVAQGRCWLDKRNSGVYVLTNTPYPTILEMIGENVIT